MSRLEDMYGAVSSYYRNMDKSRAIDAQKLESPVTNPRQSRLLNAFQKQKEMKQIKGMIGGLQRADPSARINDIETNFYKSSIATYEGKRKAAAALQQEKEDLALSIYRGETTEADRAYYERDRPMNTAQDFVARHKYMMDEDPYRAVNRQNWGLYPNTYIYRSTIAALESDKQKTYAEGYAADRDAAQLKLEAATAVALGKAAALTVTNTSNRDSIINTLEEDLRQRESGEQSIELLTETNMGARKPNIKLPKDELRLVTQPSLQANRPQ